MPDSKLVVLFLGAGASTPFDFKLATEVADEFLQSGFKDDDSRILSDLRTEIKFNRFVFDSEALMECLQGGAHPYPSLKEAGPFISSMAKIQPISKLRKETRSCKQKENLRRRFEEYIIAEYYKEGFELEKKVKLVYDRLLCKCAGIKSWKNGTPPFDKCLFEVFTTNYDNSIDLYAEQTGVQSSRGIRIRGDTVAWVWDELDQPFVRLRISKLHGSVELSRLANGDIISETPPTYPGQASDGRKILAKVMAYGLSKQLYSEPLLDMLKRLRDTLHSVIECTVVGYSFRDPWIRRIFEDASSNRKQGKFRLRIVSKSAKEIAKGWEQLRSYIDPVPMTVQEYLEL
jgi:hypothetical protein